MTTSGSYQFDPTFAAILDEAFERAGMSPAAISHVHIKSAKMSLNLMLSQWAARDSNVVYRIKAGSSTVSSGTNYFTLDTGMMDVTDVVMEYNSSGYDSTLAQISRQDWIELPNKDVTGEPTQYYLDRAVSLNAPRVYLWPTPDATCVFTYDGLRRHQTVTALSETIDVENAWLEAVASGLAQRIAEKYNVGRLPILVPRANEAYRDARATSGGSSHVIISGRGFGTARTRRR